MAAIPDLWGDIGVATLRAPVTILREQATLLGEKTKNLLEARVESWPSQRDFHHSFNIVVPALNGYTYELFTIIHGPELYPVFVVGENLQMHTEEIFTAWLHAQLSSPKTKKILGNLLAQVSG